MARRIIKQAKGFKQGALALQETSTALYIRVSTEKQASEGNGLEAQRNELNKYCASQGWIVAPEHIYIDAGISGKTDDRPAFQAMLQAAQAKQIGRIVATKLDRIARNLKNLLQTVDTLKSYGCALVIKKEAFDTSTPQGTFVMQMLGAVGELERSMIGERVMSGKRQQATTGEYNGSRCPLGYDYKDSSFTINEQARTVRQVFDLFLSGQSINAIARHMNDSRTPTALGGAWYASTVRTILGNGAYAGVAQWDGVEAALGAYPAIIGKEIYEATHRRLQALRPGIQSENKIEERLQAA